MDVGDNGILLNDLVASFLRIVELCWPELKALNGARERDDALTQNWLQAQWEIIVEQSLHARGNRCSLLIYGNGAETETSRVFDPDAVETHAVCCRPKTGLVLSDHHGGKPVHFPSGGYALDEFVALSKDGHGSEPPYDGAMLVGSHEEGQDGRPMIFLIRDLDFLLTPLRTDSSGRVSLRPVPSDPSTGKR